MLEPTPSAFRAQLIVPEQRQLFDDWLERCVEGRLPVRGEIRPAHFPRLLPFISLIDCIAPESFKVRLAGTRLREVYDCEITGLDVACLDCGDDQSYWLNTYKQIFATRAPAQGVVRAPQKSKDHLVQFWLRLPLADATGAVNMILAHDSFVPAMEMPDHAAVRA